MMTPYEACNIFTHPEKHWSHEKDDAEKVAIYMFINAMLPYLSPEEADSLTERYLQSRHVPNKKKEETI